MNRTIYLRLISPPERSSLRYSAGLIRTLLAPLSWPYGAVVRVRNHLYTTGRRAIHRVGVPVICVGNLTTGGTGKTPLVVWLCRHLREKKTHCAILTRGYKAAPGQLSDEPALLSAQCPGVPVVVDPDRVVGAAQAISRHNAQVLVMDDGFQHRRLARDLDIVVLDATRPFGHGRMLPAGLLREPVTGLRRAHAVVLTRCDQVSKEALGHIEEMVRRINRNLVVARSVHAPVRIETQDGTRIDLGKLRGQRIFAFCGIGNPRSFFHAVEHLGGVLVGTQVYDDHYRYTTADLSRLRKKAARLDAALVLTTQKDWTKVAPLAGVQDTPPLACLAVELRLTAGAENLTALIDRLLGSTMPGR